MRRVAWVSVLAAAGVLAGCSGPAQPSTTLPTSAAGTTAEPTLEPQGPADFPVPDEAREQTEDGAVAMATYYLDLINFVTSVSPPSARSVVDLSSDCTTCRQIADGVDGLAAAGQRVEGAQLSVLSFGSTSVDGDTASVVWLVQESPSRTIDASGQDIPSEARPGQQLSGGVDLVWDANSSAWVVTQLVLDSL